MRNQTVRKQSIQEQVFNEVNIYRASQVYKKYINFRLEELKEALDSCCYEEAEVIKVEIDQLRQNLVELGYVEYTPDMPKSTKGVQSLNVLTPKNVKKALSVYRGYVDVYLDILLSAIDAGDTQQMNDAKQVLECLRQNITELERSGIK